jgi:hypothetical protein
MSGSALPVLINNRRRNPLPVNRGHLCTVPEQPMLPPVERASLPPSPSLWRDR